MSPKTIPSAPSVSAACAALPRLTPRFSPSRPHERLVNDPTSGGGASRRALQVLATEEAEGSVPLAPQPFRDRVQPRLRLRLSTETSDQALDLPAGRLDAL